MPSVMHAGRVRRSVLVLLATATTVGACLLPSPAAQASTQVLATTNAAAATYTNTSHSTRAYDTSSSIYVSKSKYTGYLQFDLSGVDLSKVTGAKLSLTTRSTKSKRKLLVRASTAVTAAGITAAAAPGVGRIVGKSATLKRGKRTTITLSDLSALSTTTVFALRLNYSGTASFYKSGSKAPSLQLITTDTTTSTAGDPGTSGGPGVPSGTSLTKVTGDLTITQDGYVLDGVDLYGYVSVKANNVTIKNSIIRGGATATSDRALIMDWNGGTNLVVKDTTLVPQHRSIWLDGISGKNFTAERLDVSGVVDAVKVLGSGVTIRGSFLHDAYYQGSGVSYQSDGQTHNDAVQIEGGGNIALTGNTMTGFHNAAVMITQNSSTITGVTLQNNTLAGGGCTINLSEKGKGAMTGVKMLTNKFGTNRDSSTSCPIIMPPATLAIAQVSGNTWLDNGTTVNARQGT